jgi:hypothetical protein
LQFDNDKPADDFKSASSELPSTRKSVSDDGNGTGSDPLIAQARRF